MENENGEGVPQSADELKQKVDALDQRFAEVEGLDQRIAEVRKECADTIRELHEKCASLHARVAAIEAEDQSFSEWFAGLFGDKKSDREQQPVSGDGEQQPAENAEESDEKGFVIG
jgi:hypothetical protein